MSHASHRVSRFTLDLGHVPKGDLWSLYLRFWWHSDHDRRPQPSSGTQRRTTLLRENNQCRCVMRTLLTPQVGGRLQHFIRRLDGLGVDFIRPLPRDEIDHFFHHTDIGDFEHSL